jgi:hypothetical protein
MMLCIFIEINLFNNLLDDKSCIIYIESRWFFRLWNSDLFNFLSNLKRHVYASVTEDSWAKIKKIAYWHHSGERNYSIFSLFPDNQNFLMLDCFIFEIMVVKNIPYLIAIEEMAIEAKTIVLKQRQTKPSNPIILWEFLILFCILRYIIEVTCLFPSFFWLF